MPLGDNPVEWRRMLMDQRIDGAIVLSRLLPQLAEILASANIPTALVNADTECNLPKVMADEYDGAKQTMKHLFSLGHKRIIFLLGNQPPHYSVKQRIAGYKEGMTAAGLTEQIRIYEGDAAQFAREWRGMPNRPTAVVCYTHYLAIKLLQQARENQVVVPKDLSVTCFSNAYPVEDVIPPLTTVALATVQMGRSAAELVMEQIESKGVAPKRGVVLKTNLIVRASTAAPSEK
jgi:LacI family transcriptional regulator